MKADERHKMKTNELAESLNSIRDYFRHHSSRILTGIIVLLVLVFISLWFQNARVTARLERIDRLQSLILKANSNQFRAVQQSADPEGAIASETFDNKVAAASLAELAQEESGTPLALAALMQQAEASKSALYFANYSLDRNEKKQLADRLEKTYQRIINDHPQNKLAVGWAKLSQALLAEELQAWDQARKIYTELANDTEGKLAGTIFPLQARRRLDIFDDIDQGIVFAPAPPESEKVQPTPETPPADPAATNLTPDTTPTNTTKQKVENASEKK